MPARGRRMTSAERFRLQGSRLRVLQRRQGISDRQLGMTVGNALTENVLGPPGMAVAYRRALRLHRRIFVSAACTTTHPDGTVAMRRLVQLGRCVTAGFRCRTERNWDTFRKQASQRTTAKGHEEYVVDNRRDKSTTKHSPPLPGASSGFYHLEVCGWRPGRGGAHDPSQCLGEIRQ